MRTKRGLQQMGMKRLGVTLTGLFAVVVGAAACQTPVDELAPLNDEALRAAFQDMSVSNETMVTGGPEEFHADGRYTYQSRYLMEGTYNIDAGEVCVALAGTVRCRRFARDAAGNIFLIFIREGERGGAIEPPVAFTLRPITQ